MSFTKISMSATTPESSGPPSIGSVAANFSRTEEDEEKAEFLRFKYGSALAEIIRQWHGEAAYEEYLADLHERATREKEKKATKVANVAKLKLRFKKVFEMIVCRH